MRLDLFLKQSCLFKRRSIAKTLCDKGRVSINGAKGKPGRAVAVGDEMEIDLAHRFTRLKVLSLPLKQARKSEARTCYEILESRQKKETFP